LRDRDPVGISLAVDGERKYSWSATSVESRKGMARRLIAIREEEGDRGAALS
jgi:hypothetical protein